MRTNGGVFNILHIHSIICATVFTVNEQFGEKMKIYTSITDEEYDKIEKYIECREWANPMQDEFIFYDPKPRFLTMLALFNIEYWREE